MQKAAIALIIISVLVILFFTLTPREEAPAPPPTAELVTLRATTAGDVVGFIDRHGARAWKGIPFAAPPVGNLRWRAPQPPDAWSGAACRRAGSAPWRASSESSTSPIAA